ncbi:hypothetical protein QBC34DRAFT_400508 [Podospora aff. communis PSN243]|uniref:SWI5-dependent HO expression protein 3 n=1 Tax=Podospora aff. communis PSN243 TaxID=3040156 RepID=A0AAV9GWX6_9PEZI|nr:hypothetical protein QBC34DRAFT_400508 [Podospora aff. communis PSN243]
MSRSSPAKTTNGKALPSIPSHMQAQQIPSRMNSTIRTVTSFDDRHRLSEDSSFESRHSGFSSSVNSNTSMSSSSQDHSHLTQNGNTKGSTGVRSSRLSPAIAQEGFLEVPRTNSARSSVEIPQRESSLSATATSSTIQSYHESHHLGSAASHNDLSESQHGWDSTVGKAGLGKTGRVINRLVSDNEALKRDIKIERLRAEESKQTARLLEDKLERIVSDYESRLLEANVTKTLLARKERQVESLQSSVELEKKRAVDARERERIWKEEMEKVRTESLRKVDEATNYAALVEGRYNAISSHWKDQGEEVKRTVTNMKTEITELLEERRKDDDRIGTLRDLCDQQDGNIRELQAQKEEIAAQFERYKAEQEAALREIKEKAAQREREQEAMLRESKEVLDKLKWALSVKEKIEWAQ